jgi:hypothetical protein
MDADCALVAVDPVVEAALEMVASDSGEWKVIDWPAMNDCWRKARKRTTQAGLYLEETEVIARSVGSDDQIIFEVTSAGLLYEEWLAEQVEKHAPKSWRTWRGKVREGWGCELRIVRRVLTDQGKQAQRDLEHGEFGALRLLLSVYYSKVRQPKPNLRREPRVYRSNTEWAAAATENAVSLAAAQAIASNQVNVTHQTVDGEAMGRGIAAGLAPFVEALAAREAAGSPPPAPKASTAPEPVPKVKRKRRSPEDRVRFLSQVLTIWHGSHDQGGNGQAEPISIVEAARQLECSEDTARRAFRDKFGEDGYDAYVALVTRGNVRDYSGAFRTVNPDGSYTDDAAFDSRADDMEFPDE